MKRPAIDVKLIGWEQLPVVVIDDCFEDPSAWRACAAESTYDVSGGYYPGIRALVPARYSAEVGPILVNVLRSVFGFTERGRIDRAYFSIISTEADDLNLAQRIPHIDGVEDGLIAIIHYLAEEDQGGTAFYRHRSTGFESVNGRRHADYLKALRQDFLRCGEPAAAYIDGDTELFERTACFSGHYNRALIYSSNLLHCSATYKKNGFHASPDTGRLTIAGFISAR